MPGPLHGRSVLELSDFTRDEIVALLALARELKAAKRSGAEVPRLTGRQLVLLFEKTSTRTRCAFEVAARDQGMGVTYLDPASSQFGHKESVKDTARVLGRMFDAIEFRGYAQRTVEELARWSGVPVFNGLTDESHPTQVLADLLTMEEHGPGRLDETACCFLGDARNNMGHSLLLAGARMGMDIRLAAPAALQPAPEVVARARTFAAASGARITITDDPHVGVRGAHFVYTDVWVSLGEPPALWDERIALLRPYQVDAALMAATGVPSVKFLHCLPAFHDRETAIGEEIFRRFGLDGIEVTDEVFESPASVVWDQAENRVHTIKALLVATLGA
jgi:ornithine carbamoyltransferase